MLRDGYIYCPRCREKLQHSQHSFKCSSCDLIIYLNSKPTASILPVKGDKVLLSRRAIDPFKGELDIIGGFLNNGEDPEIGVRREAKEETGLEIEPIKLLGIHIDVYIEDIYTLNLIYLGKIINGKMKAQDDIASLEWIKINNLPPLNGFQNTRDGLFDLQKWYQNQ